MRVTAQMLDGGGFCVRELCGEPARKTRPELEKGNEGSQVQKMKGIMLGGKDNVQKPQTQGKSMSEEEFGF